MIYSERKAIRRALIERDGRRCFYCSRHFDRHLRATFEHLTPLALGGTDALDNLVLACEPCNAAVGDAPRAEKMWAREWARRVVAGTATVEQALEAAE